MICAYTENRWTELCAAVAEIQQQTFAPRELLVVIDHNEALRARAHAELRGACVVPNHHPRGLSGARNTGVQAARSEIVAFLDEDAVPAPDWLERLLVHYQEPCVAGVGGSIQPQWVIGQPGWFPAEFHWVVGCTYRGMPARTMAVRNLIGCNMSFRREIVERVGGFRNGLGRIGTLPVGCEETELCIRVRQREANSVLLYEPAARVRHRVPAERSMLRYFVARCYAEGRSKAQVAKFVGAADGLSSERTYTLRTLPKGFIRNLGNAVARRDRDSLLKAGAIALGLGVTTVGYGLARLADARRSDHTVSVERSGGAQHADGV